MRLQGLNPLITIETYPFYFQAENAATLADSYDIIVDGSDNFSTRYLLNDYCVLNHKPYVYGSIFRFEGQLSVFNADSGPCYRCIFPTPPPAGLIPTCGEGGVFGVLPGIIGALQASEVIKLVLGIGEPAAGKLFLFDALDLSLQSVQLRKNPACAICGSEPTIKSLQDTALFCNAHDALEQAVPTAWEIDVSELKKLLENNKNIRIIDVRDPVELQVSAIPSAINIPYEHLSTQFKNENENLQNIFVCRNGIRSARAVKKLRAEGMENAFNLSGGMNAWVRSVDQSQFLY